MFVNFLTILHLLVISVKIIISRSQPQGQCQPHTERQRKYGNSSAIAMWFDGAGNDVVSDTDAHF